MPPAPLKRIKQIRPGVASGVVEGIAFRASIPEGTLEMSVNLPEANLAKLQSKLSGRYPDNTVAYRNFGIVVMLPKMESLSGEDFLIFLRNRRPRRPASCRCRLRRQI